MEQHKTIKREELHRIVSESLGYKEVTNILHHGHDEYLIRHTGKKENNHKSRKTNREAQTESKKILKKATSLFS